MRRVTGSRGSQGPLTFRTLSFQPIQKKNVQKEKKRFANHIFTWHNHTKVVRQEQTHDIVSKKHFNFWPFWHSHTARQAFAAFPKLPHSGARLWFWFLKTPASCERKTETMKNFYCSQLKNLSRCKQGLRVHCHQAICTRTRQTCTILGHSTVSSAPVHSCTVSHPCVCSRNARWSQFTAKVVVSLSNYVRKSNLCIM